MEIVYEVEVFRLLIILIPLQLRILISFTYSTKPYERPGT